MRVIAFSLLVIMICNTPGMARLQDNILQSRVRYGNPVESLDDLVSPILHGAENKTYHYRGWIIRAAFSGNKTIRIQYEKKTGHPGGQAISDTELHGILNNEKGNGTWTIDHSDRNPYAISLLNLVKPPIKWINSNGCMACLINNRTILILDTPQSQNFKILDRTQKRSSR